MDKVEWPRLRRGLVAILRGITPDEAEAVSDVLIEEGFEALEVPLNSPNPIVSIACMVKCHGSRALIGGGTMLSTQHVDLVADVGGRLMVSPNMRPDVIARSQECGMVSLPGVLTPTEAFAALDAGASGLKFFPASLHGPQGISSLLAVLPKGVVVGAVGGVSAESMSDYVKVGVTLFGMGTSIYRPGDTADRVREKARTLVACYDAALAQINP